MSIIMVAIPGEEPVTLELTETPTGHTYLADPAWAERVKDLMPPASELVARLRQYGATTIRWKYPHRGTDDHTYTVSAALPGRLNEHSESEMALWLVREMRALGGWFEIEPNPQGEYDVTAIFLGHPPLVRPPRTSQTPEGLT